MDNPLVQPDPGLFIWTILTFLVLVALLARFAWRPLLQALEGRQAGIAKSLEDAQHAKEELDRLNRESAQMMQQRASRRKPSSPGAAPTRRCSGRTEAEVAGGSGDDREECGAADSVRDGARRPADPQRGDRSVGRHCLENPAAPGVEGRPRRTGRGDPEAGGNPPPRVSEQPEVAEGRRRAGIIAAHLAQTTRVRDPR